MKIISVIFIILGLLNLHFLATLSFPYGIDIYDLVSLIIGLIIFCLEKRLWVRCASLILIIITIFVLLNEISISYRFWPRHLEKRLYISELQRTKPELIRKENKLFMKVIYYQKDTTNLFSKQKTNVFLKYVGNYHLYFLYPILAFSFFIIALNNNERKQRVILVLCGSVFLALMLIVLQLKYMQWKQEIELKYDTIKKELIKQSLEDNKEIIEKLPNVNNNSQK